jgi:hypothetical protein
LCPSWAAQRAAALAAFPGEEVLADVGHAQWVFSIPKIMQATRQVWPKPGMPLPPRLNGSGWGKSSRADYEIIRSLQGQGALRRPISYYL